LLTSDFLQTCPSDCFLYFKIAELAGVEITNEDKLKSVSSANLLFNAQPIYRTTTFPRFLEIASALAASNRTPPVINKLIPALKPINPKPLSMMAITKPPITA
jgi:hypothetical protein